MIADEQTHRLPEADAERRRVAALCGEAPLRRFDAAVARILKTRQPPLRRAVRRGGGAVLALRQPGLHRGRGRPGDPGDPGAHGVLQPGPGRRRPSAPGTTAASPPPAPSAAASCSPAWRRACWRRPTPPARRTPPSTASPTSSRGLSAGRAGAVAVPGPAASCSSWWSRCWPSRRGWPRTLARRPAALDAMLDRDFFARFEEGRGERGRSTRAVARADGFEAAMDAVRRVHREQAFRIGVQVMSGAADAPRRPARPSPTWPTSASRPWRPAALAEAERAGRRLPRRGGGGRAGQVRLARDDRRLGPRPDDPLRAADPRGDVGGQGLGRGDLLRPLHPAAGRGPVGARPPRAGSTRSTCSCGPPAPRGRWR